MGLILLKKDRWASEKEKVIYKTESVISFAAEKSNVIFTLKMISASQAGDFLILGWFQEDDLEYYYQKMIIDLNYLYCGLSLCHLSYLKHLSHSVCLFVERNHVNCQVYLFHLSWSSCLWHLGTHKKEFDLLLVHIWFEQEVEEKLSEFSNMFECGKTSS